MQLIMDKEKTNLPVKRIVEPISDETSIMISHVASSTESKTEYYTEVKGGRVSAVKTNYPGGIEQLELTKAPALDHKYEYSATIKKMYKEGKRMEDIAKIIGISTSYAYKLARK